MRPNSTDSASAQWRRSNMPRELTADEKTVVTGKNVRLGVFVVVHWPSGDARFWSGVGPFIYEGESFAGVGDLGSISQIKESTTGRANGITISLGGCSPESVALVLTENYQHRKAEVYVGFLSADDTLVSGLLRPVFVGVVDVATDEDDGEMARITLSIEPRMIIAQQASGRRITHESRIAEHPGDLGYEYITAVNREMVDNWGAPGPSILQRSYGQSQLTS
jgi:hypothetical protein